MYKLLFTLLFLASCSAPKYYYPTVSSVQDGKAVIRIERKMDVIQLTVRDSTLKVGDTVILNKGINPVEVKIIDKYNGYPASMFIIR